MKEQYIGDVKDYGKYRLLQTLCGSTGLRLGINWYLTPDDSTKQGNFGSIDRCEDELYLKVRGLKKKKATLTDVESADILPKGTITYRKALEYVPGADNRSIRASWHYEALDTLACCDVIFLDPDIGVVANDLLDNTGKLRDGFFRWNAKRDGTRYVNFDEVRDYLNHGKSLILFQYGQRMGIEPQLCSVYGRLTRFIGKPDITYIFRYSKATADAIAFICYNQTKHAHLLERFKEELLDSAKPWSAYFSVWEEAVFSKALVNKGKIMEAAALAGAPVGKFVVETLRCHFGPDWWSEVESFFRNHSYPPRPAGRSDAQRADTLDISKSLQLIDGLWQSVFSKYMQKKPDVHTAVRLYNIAKHENNQSGFSDIDTYHALMAMISVLEMTGNRAEATLLRQNYLDVGDKINVIVKPQLDEIKKEQERAVASTRQNQPFTADSRQSARRPLSPKEMLRNLIMQVPKGKVTTYGWLAQQIYGSSAKSMGVLSMIKDLAGTLSVPCHRVVSTDGQPKAPDAEYSNTGKTHKQLLLDEGVLFIDSQTIDLGKCMFRPRIL